MLINRKQRTYYRTGTVLFITVALKTPPIKAIKTWRDGTATKAQKGDGT